MEGTTDFKQCGKELKLGLLNLYLLFNIHPCSQLILLIKSVMPPILLSKVAES